jgi:hypothetical protein
MGHRRLRVGVGEAVCSIANSGVQMVQAHGCRMCGLRHMPVVDALPCQAVSWDSSASRFTLPFPSMSRSSPCSPLREPLSQLFVLQRFSAGNRAVSRCFFANYHANWHFAGRGQVRPCEYRHQLNVAFETCRPGLGPLGRPSAGRASILFADNPGDESVSRAAGSTFRPFRLH